MLHKGFWLAAPYLSEPIRSLQKCILKIGLFKKNRQESRNWWRWWDCHLGWIGYINSQILKKKQDFIEIIWGHLFFFQVFYFFDAIMTLIISIAIMTLIITVEWKSGEGSIIGKKHALEKYDQFFIFGNHITNFLLKKN